jgi:hypothetical protein
MNTNTSYMTREEQRRERDSLILAGLTVLRLPGMAEYYHQSFKIQSLCHFSFKGEEISFFSFLPPVFLSPNATLDATLMLIPHLETRSQIKAPHHIYHPSMLYRSFYHCVR